jgi:hypothetical protein
MKIDGTTTFTQIHQQFQAGGEFHGKAGEKHLRLVGDSLHLHREDKSSGIHFLDRKTKHKEALQALKDAIDVELGPGAGNTVFKNLRIKSNVSVGEMAAIKQEFDRVKAGLDTAGKALPRNLELVPVKGQPTLMAGRLSHATGTNQLQGMTDQIDRTLAGLRPSQQHPEVAQQFLADFHRMEITLTDGRRSTEVPNKANLGDAAVNTLKHFAGDDDDITLGLSKLLTQSVFNAAHAEMTSLLRNEQGKSINAGVGGTVDGNAKNQMIEVRKEGGDFVIDFRLASKLSGLSGDGTMVDLSGTGASRLDMSMQIRISAANLKAGNLDYQVTRPPQFDLQVVFDPARHVDAM